MTEIRGQKSEITKATVLGAMVFALCSLLLAPCCSAQAQQPTKIPRIGYLSGSSLSAAAARVAAFQHGLRDLGYVEGKNIVIEWRAGEGNSIEISRMRPNWCGSRWTSSLRPVGQKYAQPGRRPPQFPLS